MLVNRRTRLPSMWALLFLAGCVLLSMVITFRARAQDAGTTQPATTAPAPESKPETATPPPAAPNTSKRAPASKPEEGATIGDDPTLVPDDKESADNNVTFPVDI